MKIFLLQITLRAIWVHSLKEKRMILRSIIQKLKNKFNVSVAEVEMQDVHQTLVIGVTGIASNLAQLDSIVENIINFIEENTDAEIINIDQEVLR